MNKDKSKYSKNLNIRFSEISVKINSKVKTINTSRGTNNASAKVGEIRDFS